MEKKRKPFSAMPGAVSPLSFLLLVVLLTACTSAQPQSAPAPVVNPAQSIIFHNGEILTMEPDQPVVEAIALRGEKIEALGSSEDILALRETDSTVIDLSGGTLMPGFVDAHTHILNDARTRGQSLDQAQSMALRNGITTLANLYAEESFVREMQDFTSRGQLRVRTSLYMVANTNCGDNKGDWYKKYPSTRQPGEMLRIGGVKIFTDGGSCGGVALSFELEPGQGQGDLWLTQDRLNAMVSEAQASGYQVAIHAIGDRAVAQAQDAIAFALDGGANIYRHRMEHLSVLQPEYIPRFGELGIIPVLNGEYPACTPFGPPIPVGYREWEWPWRDLRDANPDLNIAWHSDYPFLSVSPFVHLYGFVTRYDAYRSYNCRSDEWLMDDTLTVQESLSIMTIQSAYALFRNEEVGSLRPGKFADVIVLSDNPLTVPAEEIKDLKVLATLVGGRFEYCSPYHAALCPGFQQRAPIPLPDLRPPVAVRWLVLVLALVLPLVVVTGSRRSEARHWLVRLSGLSALLGGGVWIWGWMLFINQSDTMDAMIWPLVIAGTLLATASVSLASVERPNRLGWLGIFMAALGMILMVAGLILSSWFRLENAWWLLGLGLLGHLTGLPLYGLSNRRARRRWALHILPLAVGIMGALLPTASIIFGDSDWQLILLGGGIGAGWILIGLAISISDRSAED